MGPESRSEPTITDKFSLLYFLASAFLIFVNGLDFGSACTPPFQLGTPNIVKRLLQQQRLTARRNQALVEPSTHPKLLAIHCKAPGFLSIDLPLGNLQGPRATKVQRWRYISGCIRKGLGYLCPYIQSPIRGSEVCAQRLRTRDAQSSIYKLGIRLAETLAASEYCNLSMQRHSARNRILTFGSRHPH